MQAIRTRNRRNDSAQSHRERTKGRSLPLNKCLEIAFWGTIFFGFFRMAAHFLNLTPYGLDAYARPVTGLLTENSWAGIALGALVLFGESLLSTVLFSILFQKTRMWWSGLLFGAVLLAVAGYFFRIGNWEVSTFSTEAAWFLSYGLFIGMTVTLEQSDEDQ